MELTKKLSLTGLLPVVKLRSPDLALPLAEALAAGGLAAAEITFRTDAAQESIRIISRERPDFFIAAGTVLSPENADRAVDAGASLVVSPGLNAAVVEHCLKKGYPVNRLRQRMGMVFQSFNLFGHMTVIENIMMAPMRLLGKSKQEAYDTGMRLLRTVGLAEKA